MSEFRFDPIKTRWVVIDPDHPIRHDRVAPTEREDAAACPLCPGHEHAAGLELYRQPGRDGAPWSARVVPNGRPMLRTELALARRGEGLYDVVSGTGAHEVVIETPRHGTKLADHSVESLREVFRAVRARFQDLRRDVRLRYHLLHRSEGVEAGARIAHAHCQLLATPEIPPALRVELTNARQYFHRKERCLFCDLIAQETESGARVALDADRYVALAPFASARPFELWLFPKRHAYDFAGCDDEELLHLSSALREVAQRLDKTLESPAFTVALHTAPPMHPRPGQPETWNSLPYDWHWHVEIVPRITRVSGLELDSGFSVNPVPPEQAAEFLRKGTLLGERR